MPVEVEVTAEALGESDDEALLLFTFTNSNAFTCGAGPIYYYAAITDGTTDQTVTFSITATAGTIAADTDQEFSITNTEGLTGTITLVDGRILYTAA